MNQATDRPLQRIHAAHDDEGIFVYQACRAEIATSALAHGTFARGFKFDRMTWIKPNFGWMLYRAGYGDKPGQEHILKIKISHDGFLTCLRAAVLSTYQPLLYPDREAWRRTLKAGEARVQWDPDRSLALGRLERRAIQIGLRGSLSRRYVEDWIIGLADVTVLTQAVKAAVANRRAPPPVPEERIYDVPDDIKERLAVD